VKDNKVNNNRTWQNLDWEKKVTICQQGISHGDNLLFTYVVIFIALEAIFFATVFNIGSPCWRIVVASLGILVSIYFILVFKWRGDDVDRWGAVLHSLWKEVQNKHEDVSGVRAEDFVRHYKGCVERKNRGWKAIFFGWCTPCERMKYYFRSTRRFMTICTPLLVIVVWVVIILNISDF
jgi:hypothetical protein